MWDTSETAESNTKIKVALFLFFGAWLQSRSADDDGRGDCSSFTLFLNAVKVTYVVFASFFLHPQTLYGPAGFSSEWCSWGSRFLECGCYDERIQHGSALEDPRCSQPRLLQRFIVVKVGGHFIHLFFRLFIYMYKKPNIASASVVAQLWSSRCDFKINRGFIDCCCEFTQGFYSFFLPFSRTYI